MILKIENILEIRKHYTNTGYEIEFENGKIIYLTKRRTIIALLILIKYGEGTESDLAKGSNKIAEIKQMLGDKIPEGYIQEFYGDANKPYSELWNEEGFTWIDNLKGGRSGKSQKYILKAEDHYKFFEISHKAFRKSPSNSEKDIIRQKQNYKCNLCGAKIFEKNKIKSDTYAKDRRREVFDHRIPIEKGGKSENMDDFQALCFYCNKSKWQICNICFIEGCDVNCVLAYPENSQTISPTQENISDLLANRQILDS